MPRSQPTVLIRPVQRLIVDVVAGAGELPVGLNRWRLWKADIARENYARADEPGVVIVFEVDGVDEARR